MATANFTRLEASKVFALEIEDEYEFDMNQELITERLSEEGFYLGNPDIGGAYLGTKNYLHQYQDFSVEVIVHAVMLSGYYGGANLDYVLEFFIDGDETDPCDTIMLEDDLTYIRDNYELKINPKKYALLAQKKFSKLEDEARKEIEKIYREYSTPLKVLGHFSNGEAIYETE